MKSPFSAVTWDQLDEWAGEEVVARGKRYQQNVELLKRVDDHHLIALVEGRDRYQTEIWIEEEGELECRCSCPYHWRPCCSMR